MIKIHNIFFDILCDVYYHLVKFEFKIPLVHGEIKKTNSIRGYIEPSDDIVYYIYLLAVR